MEIINNYITRPLPLKSDLDLNKVHKKILEAVNIVQNSHKNPKNVIIFDIDDTLICSYTNKIIGSVWDFYHFIKKHRIIPIIITARRASPENIRFTLDQLNLLGITDFKKIFFRPDNNICVETYKKNCRKTIVDEGFNVLMSIGDMYWDIGDYGGFGVLLR